MISAAEASASTVFGLPRVPKTVISRPRLTRLVADLLDDQDLIVVRAPSGAGKTVALADWAASGATPGYISWVSLDERYTDRISFWREMILGTMRRVAESLRPAVAECAEALLAGADTRTVLRRFIPLIPPTTVVLDRLDLVKDVELIEDISWVLQRCPALKVVVATRSRSLLESPAVSLALDTGVIGAVPLTLNVEETSELLKRRGFSMDAVELHDATGGHPLLTRAVMAVYGKTGQGSISASVQTAVSDFLNLSLARSSLGYEAKKFMVRTAIPEAFTLDLAIRLSGAADVTGILNDLEDQGLGMWFRYGEHQRFEYTSAVQVMLRREVKLMDPRDIDRLTRLCIDYDLSVGNPASALRQAIDIRDLDLASRIACDHHITLLVSQAQTVLDILHALPVSRLRKHPALIMALALCHNTTSAGRVRALEYFGLAVTFAGMYRSSLDPVQRIWMLTLESAALRFAGKLEAALKYGKRAVEGFEQSPLEMKEQLGALEPTLYIQVAIAYIHDRQFDTAAALLVKAVDASRRAASVPSILLATGLLSYALVMTGRSKEARKHLNMLQDARWPPGMLENYRATTYRLAQIREAMDRQSYMEAGEYLDLINDEMQVSEFWPQMVVFQTQLDIHRIGQIAGPAMLEARIRQAHQAPLNFSGQVDLDHLRATFYLASGHPQKAGSVLIKHSKHDPRVLLMQARIALYQGDSDKTLKMTSPAGLGVLGPRLEVQRLLLRAAARLRLDDAQAAKDKCRAAAYLMDKHGLTMTGALIPREDLTVLAHLVNTFLPDSPAPFGIVPTKEKTASLTPRELVVLGSFAVHSSANDVAAALNVSVNTVKSQRRSILKKMGATSLEGALSSARRQRLLED
ncbi:helix-turn-helix transcriptional regulator [Paeniglutamicibacter antarcticus]|uniref:Helix-turn-helix transcriptional regulator n=1 Tax=Arthrobacter terrae TaxID=2935737 RepID=A0A931CLZ4_9MICC|nr:LuxR C-terminal-related transcriptional regulator [Arthrobacter terrae]MBG0738915.1 helix-turn-helix transcriptional regulator [Arthrobacter terrae]